VIGQKDTLTEDGRRLKWLPISDEFSRESVSLEVERRMEITKLIRILETAAAGVRGNKVANATTTVGITNNQLNQNHEKLS
jgi:hypothetical protein